MNKDRVKNLIRKLYRTGQGHTAEAASARERVDKLTKKYGIDLRSVIDRKKKLLGVAGDYWRSALLVSIAKSCDCQVLDQTEGKKRLAVVSGKWDDVLRTVELYRLAEIRVAVQFTAWWREESAKPAVLSPYRIQSQWPPPPRFTRQQERQIKPILLRFMAVSIAETFAGAAPSAYSEPRAPHAPPPPSYRNRGYNRSDKESRAGVPCEPPPLPPPAPIFGRRPHIPRPSPPPPPNFHRPPPEPAPSREGDILDSEIQRLVAILGQDEAKALGEGAIDSGAAAAVSLREIMRKPMLRLAVRSVAFPRAKPAVDARARTQAQIAEHIRKVISRLGG